MAQLAQQLAISERTLFRRFRETLNMTPLQYLQIIRLETAKSLLRRTRTRIQTVAQQVGYSNAAFFTELFRNHTGVTPSAYRARVLRTPR